MDALFLLFATIRLVVLAIYAIASDVVSWALYDRGHGPRRRELRDKAANRNAAEAKALGAESTFVVCPLFCFLP